MTARTKIAAQILAGLCASPTGGGPDDNELVETAIWLTERLIQRLRDARWDYDRAPSGDADDAI